MTFEMTAAEKDARLILEGDVETISDFKQRVQHADRKALLPILFALRMLFKQYKKNEHAGNLMFECLRERPLYFDGSLYGSMLTVLALYKPVSIGKAATFFTNDFAMQLLITESLLMLRDAYTDPNAL